MKAQSDTLRFVGPCKATLTMVLAVAGFMAAAMAGAATTSTGSTGTGAATSSEDESALFADTSSITDSGSLVGNPAATSAALERKTLGFSGHILTAAIVGADRTYFTAPDVKHASLAGSLVGDATLDARLLRGFRALATLEWAIDPALIGSSASTGTGDTATSFRIPEMFLDANLGHRVYFRAGKQVLQWGRCYFFNPTDLVNVERKSFFRRIGDREGTYGAKVHIPFGTAANLYGFLDAGGVRRPDSLAAAGKAEFLAGATEFSFMLWDKGGRDPVYGLDASSRVLGVDVNAEAALFQSFRSKRLTFQGGLPSVETRDRDWMPRVAVGLGKSFRISGIQDRLSTVAEFYYNQPGSEAARMPFRASDFTLLAAATGQSAPQAVTALSAAGLYEANSYSRHYAAFFASFARFLRSDLTLIFNAVGNVDQHCALLSTGIAYADLNDFGLSLNVNAFIGPGDTEYTLARQGAQVQALAEAAF